jgi:hypothetical protein
VPKAGFEPARVTPHAPQTCVSTRFHHFGRLSMLLQKTAGFQADHKIHDCEASWADFFNNPEDSIK